MKTELGPAKVTQTYDAPLLYGEFANIFASRLVTHAKTIVGYIYCLASGGGLMPPITGGAIVIISQSLDGINWNYVAQYSIVPTPTGGTLPFNVSIIGKYVRVDCYNTLADAGGPRDFVVFRSSVSLKPN